ncbi:tetrahydromethanopterin S-methyltransferase subunit A [Methanocella sp. MCL-LM]|uniref:tetrahydromethanopterin S-methyltransferase subunit A n=1 Tax=Methanocella sp. MCL-LM TaxID=3412035 RepID=UPI003C726FC9
MKTYKYGDPTSPVAVLTLASDYEQFHLTGYAIIGSCFTENLGVQLVITNMLKEPGIRYLIMCGQESLHLAGHAFAALHENGVSRVGMYRKIIGCKSPLPFIDDIPEWAIDEYMDSIVQIDMLGVQDDSAIQAKIDECIRENANNPATREAMDTGMGPVDEFTWKKYSAFQERRMMDLLKK